MFYLCKANPLVKIFINDIPVSIISNEELDSSKEFDLVIDGATSKLKPKKLIDDVLINDASPEKVDELLHVMTDNKLKGVDSITFTSADKETIIKYIKKKFKRKAPKPGSKRWIQEKKEREEEKKQSRLAKANGKQSAGTSSSFNSSVGGFSSSSYRYRIMVPAFSPDVWWKTVSGYRAF